VLFWGTCCLGSLVNKMGIKSIAIAAVALLAGVSAKEDLPPGDSLRIGVKHKPEVCDRKSKVSPSFRGSEPDSSTVRI
jgi:hypothetical protein